MRIHIPSALAGLVVAATLGLLISARSQEARPNEDKQANEQPNQQMVLLKTLEALASAQTRQAVAWETLAAKGWPQPQSSLAGALPAVLRLDLSGTLSVSQNGSWSITRF